ncbi:MAG: branched-chain amino acid ABC transporter permease, partial [Lacrimispora sphenoides]
MKINFRLNKTLKSNIITFGLVIAAYIIVQLLVNAGQVSNLMKGLLVPLCIYTIMAVSLN